MSPKNSHFYEDGEIFLQSLFTYFSYFAFDKAKEQADRERDLSKNHASPVWITLLSCIAQLAIVEKLYMNLTFLTPKGFLRKESSVRLTYETILTDLVEIEKRRATHSPPIGNASNSTTEKTEKGCSEGVLLHISSHLILFIQARLLMLSFYEKLISFSNKKHVNYEEMLCYIDEIINKNCSSFHHPVLVPIKTTFTYESEITSHLLGSLKSMQEWQFLSSLLHLHDAHSKLLSWQTVIQNKEYKKYTFGSSFLKSSSFPALYQWLWSAKSSFVSKFSLYFHEVLSSQAPPSDAKNFMSKLSCDYVGKIQAFQRKTDALSVCIILNATALPGLKMPGYCYPSDKEMLVQNIEEYPAVFAFPVKPVQFWSSIVMQISDKKIDESYDKVITLHDSKVGSAMFFCLIEPNFYLTIVFENKKPEKENFVKDFALDLALQLRCNKVFAALKPN